MVYLFVFFYNSIIRARKKMYVLFLFVFLPFLASHKKIQLIHFSANTAPSETADTQAAVPACR